MTVAEFIKLLRTFPPGAAVIHSIYSDYEEIEPGDVTLFLAADSVREGGGWSGTTGTS